MVTKRERLEVSLDGIAHFGMRPFVGLVREALDPETPWVAAGVLLRAGDRPVILTAWHVVEDERDAAALALFHLRVESLKPRPSEARLDLRTKPGKPFRPATIERAGAGFDLTLHKFVGAVHRAPGEIDVALIEPKPEHDAALSKLSPLAVEEAVEPPDAADVGATEQLCAVGMPYDLVDLDKIKAVVSFTPLVHFATARSGCVGEGHEQRGIHVDWTEAADRKVNPLGMSGGAVWRLRGRPQSEVWTPERSARLVGVCSAAYPKAYKDRLPFCERAESVADFGAWLTKTCQRIARRRG